MPSFKPQLFGLPTDKVLHFCLFLPYVFLFRAAFGRRSRPLLLLNLSTALLFAFATESCQFLFTATRHFSFADFFADSLAIVLATMIVCTVASHRNNRT